MVASGGGMVGGEQAVWRVGAMWSGADLGVVGRVAWVGRMPVVRQKDGFTLPVAESSVEPTKLRHDFESIPVDPCDRQITATDCDRQITVTVIVCLCLCTDNNVRR